MVLLILKIDVNRGLSNKSIDLGIMGLPPQKYIRTYSKLNNIIETRFDLVDFDENSGLYNLLHSIGEIEKVG